MNQLDWIEPLGRIDEHTGRDGNDDGGKQAEQAAGADGKWIVDALLIRR